MLSDKVDTDLECALFIKTLYVGLEKIAIKTFQGDPPNMSSTIMTVKALI